MLFSVKISQPKANVSCRSHLETWWQAGFSSAFVFPKKYCIAKQSVTWNQEQIYHVSRLRQIVFTNFCGTRGCACNFVSQCGQSVYSSFFLVLTLLVLNENFNWFSNQREHFLELFAWLQPIGDVLVTRPNLIGNTLEERACPSFSVELVTLFVFSELMVASPTMISYWSWWAA